MNRAHSIAGGLPPLTARIVEVLAVTVLYIALARLGQVFAVPPGNITPVWLPSGVMLALVAIRGNYLLPAVFLGAMLGNGWAYIDTSSLARFFPGAVAAVLNGLGDLACVAIGCRALQGRQAIADLLRRVRSFRQFLIFAVVLGPLASTLLGVGGLAVTGLIDGNVLGAAYVWWVGDAVGVLALTPLLLSYHASAGELPEGESGYAERTWLVACLLSLPLLDAIPLPVAGGELESAFLLVPLLFWALVRVGLRPALWAVVYLVAAELLMGVYAKSVGAPVTALSPFELQFAIAIIVPTLLLASMLIWQQRGDLRAANEAAQHDLLTGLKNRRALEEGLRNELVRQWRYRSPLSLLMFDIDYFKVINDRHGHAAGDRVLVALAELAQQDLRSYDLLARWGGEEFMLLLPGTDLTGAMHRAERLRQRVQEATLSTDFPITISVGVAEALPGVPPTQLFHAVDTAMYEAKRLGRNRVESGGLAMADPGARDDSPEGAGSAAP